MDKTENELAQETLGCAWRVHRNLGPGLWESADHWCLALEFHRRGLVFEAQGMTYLKLLDLRLGLLVNFNVPRLRDGMKRIVQG